MELGSILPVGSIITSCLTVTEFQTEYGTNWVLCNGQNVAGSKWHEIKSQNVVPDFRGYFLRMKDNGAGRDSNGDLSVGDTVGASQIQGHDHGLQLNVNLGSGSASPLTIDGTTSVGTISQISYTTAVTGGAETYPKYGVVNYFIRIN